MPLRFSQTMFGVSLLLWIVALGGQRPPPLLSGSDVPDARAAARSAEGCDPAYPDVCIPRLPPDLDCADVEARSFPVLSPDPHGFDADGNGVGCEPRPPVRRG